MKYGIIPCMEDSNMHKARKGRNGSREISPSAVVVPLFPEAARAETQSVVEDDALLLARIAERNHAAFATLVRRHTHRFYRVAYRFIGRRSEAEDITQEAFLKLWEKPGMWQPDRNTAFTTWFYRIVMNLCLDHAKKKRPQPLLDDSWIMDEREMHEDVLLAREKQRLLETQIALLPERQRTALNLCFFEGLSNREAATAMGLRLKALQALLMRAKTTLKSQLKYMIEV